jgi:hypothetical protein
MTARRRPEMMKILSLVHCRGLIYQAQPQAIFFSCPGALVAIFMAACHDGRADTQRL